MTSSMVVPLEGKAYYLETLRKMEHGTVIEGTVKTKLMYRLRNTIEGLIQYHLKLAKESLTVDNITLVKKDFYGLSVEILLTDYKV